MMIQLPPPTHHHTHGISDTCVRAFMCSSLPELLRAAQGSAVLQIYSGAATAQQRQCSAALRRHRTAMQTKQIKKTKPAAPCAG